MQTQHKKLQTHEKELFLRCCVVAECHTASKNILNKKIREYVVVHMRAAELAYSDAYKRKIFFVLPLASYWKDRCAEVINN
jgi:hypothetical protein